MNQPRQGILKETFRVLPFRHIRSESCDTGSLETHLHSFIRFKNCLHLSWEDLYKMHISSLYVFYLVWG